MTDRDRKIAVVVNDESVQLELLEILLAELGLAAHSFLDVSTALAFMSGRDAPALIITDLHMPGVDGWRFCRLLDRPSTNTSITFR